MRPPQIGTNAARPNPETHLALPSALHGRVHHAHHVLGGRRHYGAGEDDVLKCEEQLHAVATAREGGGDGVLQERAVEGLRGRRVGRCGGCGVEGAVAR